MNHFLGSPQESNWSREKIQEKISEYQQMLEGNRKELSELQADVRALQATISFQESSLEMFKAFLEEFDTDPNATQHLKIEASAFGKRTPMEMIYSQWKGMKLSDVICKVLVSEKAPLTTSELTKLIYSTKDDSEFNRARNSLSSELRAGAKGDIPLWRKIGRNAYAPI